MSVLTIRSGLVGKIDLSEAVDVDPGGVEPQGRRSQSSLDTGPPGPHQPPASFGRCFQYLPLSEPISPFRAALHRIVRMLFTFTPNTPRLRNPAWTVAGVFAASSPTSKISSAKAFFASADKWGRAACSTRPPLSRFDSSTASARCRPDLRCCISAILDSIATISARIVSSTLATQHTLDQILIVCNSDKVCGGVFLLITSPPFRDSDTRRMAATSESGAVRSTGSADRRHRPKAMP